MVDHIAASRIGFRVTQVLFTLALLTVMCGTDNEGAMCWSDEAYSYDEENESECTPEPAGQVCDPVTQRCETVCEPSEYLLVCRTGSSSSASIPLATLRDSVLTSSNRGMVVPPDSGLKCGPVRVSVAAAPKQTLYCCRCAV